MRPDRISPLEVVAGVAERLAVLLTAGVSQHAAWKLLGQFPINDGSASVIRAASQNGHHADIPHQLIGISVGTGDREAEAWATLAAAWRVATIAGTPIASTLRDLAGTVRELGATQRDVSVALAGPRATTRMVMGLPFIGVLFGVGLGFDSLRTLFATAPGLLCLGGGGLLCVVGVLWGRWLVRRAQPKRTVPGLVFDLMAIAMAGGVSNTNARAMVESACAESRLLIDAAEWGFVENIMGLADCAGVPVGDLLRSEAARVRREARFEGQRSAMRLAVRLMVPLGVCVLPAFMLLGVFPLIISIFSSTSWGFR